MQDTPDTRTGVIEEVGEDNEDEPLDRFQYVWAFCPWCRQFPAQRLTYIVRWCLNCGVHRRTIGYLGCREERVSEDAL